MILPRLLGGNRRAVFARLLANGMTQAAATAAMTLLIRRAFDELRPLQAPSLRPELWATLAAAALLVALIALLRRRERIDGEILAQSYAHRLRRAMYTRLCTTAPLELQKLSRGAVLLRFIGDLTAITQWISHGFVRLLVGAVTGVMALGVLAFIEWQLVLGVAAILLTGIATTLAFGPRFDRAVRQARERRTYLASNIAEKSSALPVVQAFGQTEREQRRLRRQSRRLKGALIERARPAGSMTAITEATAMLAMLGALGMGVLAMSWHMATAGTVIAFAAAAGFLAAPVRELGHAYEYWLRAAISREKLSSFLAGVTPPTHTGKTALRVGPGRIDLRDVGWGEVLGSVTGSARPGARIVLAGPAGTGKSVLLYLMAGLLRPERGHVEIDGQDIADVEPRTLRRAVGLVSPDLPLLRGSIADNLRYGAPQASAETVENVEQLCDIESILRQLPAGRETRVAEGGRNLSLGQRQRIGLARALVMQPRVLLLDDVDIGLDGGMKSALLRIMERSPATIVMVTRDSELLAAATAVWEPGDGQLQVSALERGARNGSAERAKVTFL